MEKINCTDIDLGRKRIVRLIEKLLAEINNDQKIRPFLRTFPFKVESLEMAISFRERDGELLERPYLAEILLCEGVIYYQIWLNNADTYNTVYNEPYEDALKIYLEEINNFEKPTAIKHR